jgi:hypothetical protein
MIICFNHVLVVMVKDNWKIKASNSDTQQQLKVYQTVNSCLALGSPRNQGLV